jgi:hypothetical protein
MASHASKRPGNGARRRAAAGMAATAKIDAGSRNSKTATTSLVGGARDPADLNRCACKPPMRKRSEEGEARERHRRRGSSDGGNGAAAGAPSGGKGVRGQGKAWELGSVRRGCGGALGALI